MAARFIRAIVATCLYDGRRQATSTQNPGARAGEGMTP
jgi:hypothetical protein